MNNYQKARLSSNKQIVIVAENNQSATDIIPSFARGIEQIKGINNEIEELAVLQLQNLTGITDDKNDVQDEATDYLIEISGAIHSYAGQQGNKTLQALVNFKPTKVEHLDRHETIDACSNVLNEARKIAPNELADEGISPEEINHFDEVITRLKSYSYARQTAGIDQKDITRRIGELLIKATDIKKNTLDRLAPQFQRKAPEFYYKYKAAANVIYKRATKSSTQAETKA
jgi:hypothetical protein